MLPGALQLVFIILIDRIILWNWGSLLNVWRLHWYKGVPSEPVLTRRHLLGEQRHFLLRLQTGTERRSMSRYVTSLLPSSSPYLVRHRGLLQRNLEWCHEPFSMASKLRLRNLPFEACLKLVLGIEESWNARSWEDIPLICVKIGLLNRVEIEPWSLYFGMTLSHLLCSLNNPVQINGSIDIDDSYFCCFYSGK